MRVKKQLLLFCLLLGVSVCLLVASDFFRPAPETCPVEVKNPVKCSQCPAKAAAESPWHFITKGILHLSA
jgi:hypothetical protein